MDKFLLRLIVIFLFFFPTLCAYAAKPLDLEHIKPSFLSHLFVEPVKIRADGQKPLVALEPISESKDFNQTVHIRLRETYAGYPVFGSEAIVHIPNGKKNTQSFSWLKASSNASSTMNGMIYQELEKDLQTAPKIIFSPEQAEIALHKTIVRYQQTNGKQGEIQKKNCQLMVYVEGQKKAHWAFKIELYVKYANKRPEIPIYIVDAVNVDQVYANWDDIISYEMELVDAGGLGGNVKKGMLSYDGFIGHLDSFKVLRDPQSKVCFLQNSQTLVASFFDGIDNPVSFPCVERDRTHNNLYWDGARDQINGGFSPEHDALYAGHVINAMYQDWFGVPALVDENKQPKLLHMVMHVPDLWRGKPHLDNAVWDRMGQKMYFGDGDILFYPLTSLDVAAHEISHGFTQQHSNLRHYIQMMGVKNESAAMNEAFSDMAAKAVQFYQKRRNTWEMADDVMKTKFFKALRYMDEPTKDCEEFKRVGEKNCSIDSVKNYTDLMDPHFSAGIYNRAFYLLATTKDWNTHKAFNVMLKANVDYWISESTFEQGACGVINAAKDYHYDIKAVQAAFNKVDIDTSRC